MKVRRRSSVLRASAAGKRKATKGARATRGRARPSVAKLLDLAHYLEVNDPKGFELLRSAVHFVAG